jgi:hypothetical protein
MNGYTAEQLNKAIQGKSASQGGLNVPSIRQILLTRLETLGVTGIDIQKAKRKELESYLKSVSFDIINLDTKTISSQSIEVKPVRTLPISNFGNPPQYEILDAIKLQDLIYQVYNNDTEMLAYEDILKLDDYWKHRLDLEIVADKKTIQRVFSLAKADSKFESELIGQTDRFVNVYTQFGGVTYNSNSYITTDEALRRAIVLGDLELVKNFFKQGAKNLNQSLQLAAENGNKEIVQYLLENGARGFVRAETAAFNQDQTEVAELIAAFRDNLKL